MEVPRGHRSCPSWLTFVRYVRGALGVLIRKIKINYPIPRDVEYQSRRKLEHSGFRHFQYAVPRNSQYHKPNDAQYPIYRNYENRVSRDFQYGIHVESKLIIIIINN